MRRIIVAAVLGIVVAASIATILGLWTSHPIGAGDNGDGHRLFCGAGLIPATPDQKANWQGGVVLEFTHGAACADPMPSSTLMVLEAAAAGQDPFNLTRLGWIYASMTGLIAAVSGWAVTKHSWAALIVVLVPLLPLATPDFTRFFVSTFSEPTGLVGTVALLSGIAVAGSTQRTDIVERSMALLLITSGALLSATAKLAFTPLLVVAGVACLAICVGVTRWRRHLAGAAALVVLLATALGPLIGLAGWQDRVYHGVNAFNLVYTVVLVEVPRSAKTLGLPAAAQGYAGNAYFPNGPQGAPGGPGIIANDAQFRNRSWTILAQHPRALLRVFSVGLGATESRAINYLPQQPWPPAEPVNLTKADVGAQGADPATFKAWRDSVQPPWKPWAISVTALLAAGLILVTRRRLSALLALAALSAAGALGIVLLAILGDGYFEIVKHVWLAAYLLDVALLALVAEVARQFLDRRKSRKPLTVAV